MCQARALSPLPRAWSTLSVTLTEEIEPSKGAAKGAHGLVRLAPDFGKA